MAFRPATHFGEKYSNRRTVEPVLFPVTIQEVKSHIRDESADEKWLANAIQTAVGVLENKLSIALITQTWQLFLDSWPGKAGSPWWDGVRDGAIGDIFGYSDYITLPRWPLASVSSVNTYNSADAATAISVNTVFFVDTQRMPGRLALRSGQTWPTAERTVNGIEITYVAGYGTSPSNVPEPLRSAILHIVAYLYSHRGDECTAEEMWTKSGAVGLLAGYRNVRI